MTTTTETTVRDWAALRAVFPDDQIEKLPKPTKTRDDDKGQCVKGSRYSADGFYCGKYHSRSVHLSYVGHAGLTMRLNDVVGPADWDWNFLAVDDAGLPIYSDGGLWITLTIWGVTKKGFGDAAGKSGPNAIKEIIGDALRNAAMRFGVATYLWSKSDAAANIAEIPEGPSPRDLAWQFLINTYPDLSPGQRVKIAAEALGRDPKSLKDDDWADALDNWMVNGLPVPAAAPNPDDSEPAEQEPAPADGDVRMISRGQSAALHAGLKDAGVLTAEKTENRRQQGLEWCSEQVGRVINSTNELTAVEASELIDLLHKQTVR